MRTPQRVLSTVLSSLNFFRIHILFFSIAPVVFAAISYASDGKYHVEYIDLLFCCMSAMTGTGLTTIDLSSLTAWQQTILFILQLAGSPIVEPMSQRNRTNDITEDPPEKDVVRGRSTTFQSTYRQSDIASRNDKDSCTYSAPIPPPRLERAHCMPDLGHRACAAPGLILSSTATYSSSSERLASGFLHRITNDHELGVKRDADVTSGQQGSVHSLNSQTHTHQRMTQRHLSSASLGGFGDPLTLPVHYWQQKFPTIRHQLQRTFTIPSESIYTPEGADDRPEGVRPVPYLSFTATVGGNSDFRGLSEQQYKELGGVEYRALSALLWIVPMYYIGTLLVAFIVIAPYMQLPRWRETFLPPQQHRVIHPIWYSAFEVVGAWANSGMTLVDQNLVPFQNAYPMLFLLIWVMLAGNTGFFLSSKFDSWSMYKCVPKHSSLHATLRFLLDHPRRCFIFLFPSHQTRILLVILMIFNLTNWIFFLILYTSDPATENLSAGLKTMLGAVQAVAALLAGFQTISISSLAPAVQVLYLIMMYIAVYPMSVTVRSTNVYEDRSLGVAEEEAIDDRNEMVHDGDTSRVSIWGRYLAHHIMWWLALVLFVLCIIERRQLSDPEKSSWFHIFALIFEIVSAYATIGLTLGVPTANYALTGAMHNLSKLIICLVMLRGRHRGLPVAMDRAVLFPTEFKLESDENEK
ncbi:hypothetical protein HETIRDRAFT_154705 [Heterobasidion irregulare TC 32-1]|uniref:Potassium transporter n=1 Tax=Heterobasidion irregulare (strain TC 32-1) TaxID=747525 RepID=W4KA10_HETIT|nr:uncharacterized protein HETIRDRAFT_154705 [Heterobasidion irregulare TC 32-1]ETW82185.1 hypothetical protein HETIRDRAFT_154705 [Heterobasidion irregulare TC 32-1]